MYKPPHLSMNDERVFFTGFALPLYIRDRIIIIICIAL